MPRQRLSDTEINIVIVPKRVRWRGPGTSTAWTKAHDCVDALQDLVRNVDFGCAEVEQSPDFSASAIARRRDEICDQALSKLVNFLPFEVAEKALRESIDSLERLSDRDPQQVQMYEKLRQALRDIREGIEAARRMVTERRSARERVSV